MLSASRRDGVFMVPSFASDFQAVKLKGTEKHKKHEKKYKLTILCLKQVVGVSSASRRDGVFTALSFASGLQAVMLKRSEKHEKHEKNKN